MRPGKSHQGSFGGDRGLGGLVVSGFAGFRGRLLPNGPQSPRLAPGGFYCVNARGIRVREGWPVPIEPA